MPEKANRVPRSKGRRSCDWPLSRVPRKGRSVIAFAFMPLVFVLTGLFMLGAYLVTSNESAALIAFALLFYVLAFICSVCFICGLSAWLLLPGCICVAFGVWCERKARKLKGIPNV
jgi:hypothetical protein